LKVKGAVWTRPEFRAEVVYRGLTTTGKPLRASFRGRYTEL
jgi:hypothetical protein